MRQEPEYLPETAAQSSKDAAEMPGLVAQLAGARTQGLNWRVMANMNERSPLHPMCSVWAGPETKEYIVCNSCFPADAHLIAAAPDLARELQKLYHAALRYPSLMADELGSFWAVDIGRALEKAFPPEEDGEAF